MMINVDNQTRNDLPGAFFVGAALTTVFFVAMCAGAYLDHLSRRGEIVKSSTLSQEQLKDLERYQERVNQQLYSVRLLQKTGKAILAPKAASIP